LEIKDILQDEGTKFRESLRLRCYGHGEKKAKPKIAKTNCKHLQWKEEGKRKYHVKDGETRFNLISV